MGRELDISRAALIVINPQRVFFDPESNFARWHRHEQDDPDKVIANCVTLVSAMKEAGRPVIFVRTGLRADYLDAALPRPVLEDGVDADPEFLVEGSWGAEYIEALAPAEDDFVVTQKGLSAFQHTHLDRLLTNLGVGQCVIVGGGTRESLGDTTRIGGVLGYELFVPDDAIHPVHADNGLQGRVEYTTTDRVVNEAKGTAAVGARASGNALVIIDMQKVFLDRDRALRPYTTDEERREGLANNQEIVDNNVRLLDAAHKAGWPVVFMKFVNRDTEEDSGLPKTGGLADWIKSRPRDWTDWGVELADGLVPDDDDIVLEKKGNGGFSFTPLHRVLRNYGVKRCIVTGGATGGCVAATVEEGVGLGYECVTVSDATYPYASPYLEELAQYGDVKSTDIVLEELEAIEAKT